MGIEDKYDQVKQIINQGTKAKGYVFYDEMGDLLPSEAPADQVDELLTTFGGAGVVEIARLQTLLRYICENGFEHHVAANLSQGAAAAVHEAATRYLGWEVYKHS